MARFEAEGLDELIASLEGDKKLFDSAAHDMLQAGGEVIAEAWRDAIRAHDLIETGDMLNAVRVFDVATEHVKKVTVYPEGRDRKGIRNAEKAFINHYGASRRKATHFVDDAETKAEGPAVDAMAAVWFDKLESEG